ncbi:MAG TPA: UDP-N-acetylmuramoyl-L-alanine--D-glutamate ligase [Candidatus Acidoferrales bacterium]|nr:UDP-N-acetylmuramoyl-L-alanine--D-glutamate ligase [Candidatus Acidoferrales bacterium]
MAVVEVSSFQLEWIEKFRPLVGVHLNLTDDHFDRYEDLEDYGRAKARLFENQRRPSDFAILNRDDPNVWKLAKSVRSSVIGFSLAQRGRDTLAVWFDEKANAIAFDFDQMKAGLISLKGFRLRGRHNISNAMAASAAALALGVKPEVIERALASFRGLPHRIEVVHENGGITYIDDSKGTNVGAVVEAIDALAAPIILIAGGLDKGGDYAPLRRPLEEKVKLAIFNGAARDKMAAALEGTTKIESVATLKQAVEHAARVAQPGDTVLLSPACSSFDQFKDYAERGNVYKELVRAL